MTSSRAVLHSVRIAAWLMAAMTLAAAPGSSAVRTLAGVRTSVGRDQTSLFVRLISPARYSPVWVDSTTFAVDFPGVETSLRSEEQTMHSPLVSSYRVFSYTSSDNTPHVRVELSLKAKSKVDTERTPGGVSIRVHSPTAAAVESGEQTSRKPETDFTANPKPSPAPRNSNPGTAIREVQVAKIEGTPVLEVQVIGNGTLEYRTLRLTNPERLVLDIPNTRNQIRQKQLAVNATPLRAVRIGQLSQKPLVSRVVMDLEAKTPFQVRNQESSLVVTLGERETKAAPAIDNAVPSGSPELSPEKLQGGKPPVTPVAAKMPSESRNPDFGNEGSQPTAVNRPETMLAEPEPILGVQGIASNAQPTDVSKTMEPGFADSTSEFPAMAATESPAPAEEMKVEAISETVGPVTEPTVTASVDSVVASPVQPASSWKAVETPAPPQPVQAQVEPNAVPQELKPAPQEAAASPALPTATMATIEPVAAPPMVEYNAPAPTPQPAAQEAKVVPMAPAMAMNEPVAAPAKIEQGGTAPNAKPAPQVAKSVPPAPIPVKETSARRALPESLSKGFVVAAPSEALFAQAAPPVQTPGAPAARSGYTGEPISVNLKDVDLKDFFRLIHEISGLNLVLDPTVSGNVTIVLDDVPWDQAMEIVMRNNGLGKEVEGNVVRIAKLSTIEAEEKQRRDLAIAVTQGQPMHTETVQLSYAKANDMIITLKKFLKSEKSDMVADTRTNTLIITDISEGIVLVRNLIRTLDQKSLQVEIEARVVSASRSFARDIGTQLAASGISGNLLLGGAGAVGESPVKRGVTPPFFVGTPPSPPEPGAAPKFANVAQPLSTNFPAAGATSGFTLALNAGNLFALDAIITAAESRGVGKLLSRPKIITQNNVEATVKQGVKIPIQTTINNTVSVQYVDVVLRLTVTPQITADGTIFLKTDIENTSIDPGIATTPGQFGLDTQTATTQVLVSNGGTVFFGGVVQNINRVSEQQVPLLGSVPLIGNMFKHKSTSSTTNELLFFITPRIVQS